MSCVMDLGTKSNGPLSDLTSSRVSTSKLAIASVPIPRDRGWLLKPFDPAKPETSRAADADGNESAEAQTDEGRSESPKAGREVVRHGLAVLLVMSAGCLFAWSIAQVVQSLLRAELFVLRSALPFFP